MSDVAIHAAYRIGCIDVLLSDDVQEVMPIPGIFRANLEGEREFRLRQLEESGLVDPEEFHTWRVDKPRPENAGRAAKTNTNRRSR